MEPCEPDASRLACVLQNREASPEAKMRIHNDKAALATIGSCPGLYVLVNTMGSETRLPCGMATIDSWDAAHQAVSSMSSIC